MKKGIIIGTIIWLLVAMVGCSIPVNTTTTTTTTPTPTTKYDTTSSIISDTISDSTKIGRTITTTYSTVTYPIDPSKVVSTYTVLATEIKGLDTTIIINTTTIYKDLTDDERFHIIYPNFYDPAVCACQWY